MPIAIDPKHIYQVRRGLYALIGGMVHTFICILLWTHNFFRTTGWGLFWLQFFFWIVLISFFLTIRFKYSSKLKDPSLTLPLMLWATAVTMLTIYLTNDYRTLLLMFYLLCLIFGVFQLDWRYFIVVIITGILSYLLVIILLLKFHPSVIEFRNEIIVFYSFSVMAFCCAAVSIEMNNVRKHLRNKNLMLEEALRRIESLSITDELTGIKNRRFILGLLEQQRLLAERGLYAFSICMIDLDHFKEMNDEYGHIAGDEILKEIAKKISAEIRKIDYFARYGGEEFLLVLPFADLEQAKLIAERLRKFIEDSTFDEIRPNLKLTFSAGITEYHWPESIASVLGRADAALYVAKHAGRNQVASD